MAALFVESATAVEAGAELMKNGADIGVVTSASYSIF